MNAVLSYVTYLAAGIALLIVFFLIYCRVTAYHEWKLIRRGNSAAALSFSGALIGFSLTLASSIMHSDRLLNFVAWGAGALLMQILTYLAAVSFLRRLATDIEENNVAVGGALGALSLTVGILNAACLSY